MERVSLNPRPDWQAKASEIGFTYHSLGERPSGENDGLYWYEGAAYRFSSNEIDLIEEATRTLHNLCLSAVEYVVMSAPHLMDEFSIRPDMHESIRRSWLDGDMPMMGRFDLAYDPASGQVKMLEYNADTPTLLIESSLMQWFWLQASFSTMDQFNSLHENLLARYKVLGRKIKSGCILHVAGLSGEMEELQHCRYFMDLAQQAGIMAKFIDVKDIGFSPSSGKFVDLQGVEITNLQKLYPWEWMAQEPFGVDLAKSRVRVIEPIWKMLLSNKAILPLLWKLNPGHPNLLASGWSSSDVGANYIKKPILAREGANMTMRRVGSEDFVTGGSYENSPMIFQDLASVPVFDDQHMILGSWVIGEEPAGIVVRESDSPIIVNTSRVVPHFFS